MRTSTADLIHPRVELRLGDARDVLPKIDQVDLIVADLAYGVDFQSGRRVEALGKIEGDKPDDRSAMLAIMAASVSRLRRHRHVYSFGPKELISDERLTAHAELIWDKGSFTSGNLSSPWGSAHEPIHFAVFNSSAFDRKQGAGSLAARLRRGSVLRVNRRNPAQIGKHPNEKPVELLRMLVESSSCLGETVLDPTMGSASAVVATLLAGRRAVGIEKDPEHFATARARVERVLRWLDSLPDP